MIEEMFLFLSILEAVTMEKVPKHGFELPLFINFRSTPL